MSMQIITGKTGTLHVTSEQAGAENAGIYGSGRYVFDLDQRFNYEIISNNLIRIKNGYGINQGRTFGIAINDYEEVPIDNGLAGVSRYDLIVARYTKISETGIESVTLEVVKGTSSTTPVVPAYTVGNILNGEILDDFVLYKVLITDLSIISVTKMFVVNSNLETKLSTTGGTMTGAIEVNEGVSDFTVYKNVLQHKSTSGTVKQIVVPFPISDHTVMKIIASFIANHVHYSIEICAEQSSMYYWYGFGGAKSSNGITNIIDRVTLHKNTATQQLSIVLSHTTATCPITHMSIDEIWINGTVSNDYVNGFSVNDVTFGSFILENPTEETFIVSDVVKDIVTINTNLTTLQKRKYVALYVEFTDYFAYVDISSYGTLPTYPVILATLNSSALNNAVLLRVERTSSTQIQFIFSANPGAVNIATSFTVV